MKLRCKNCGIVQTKDQERKPADRVMRDDEGITVCWNCGSVYADYVIEPAAAWGEGIVLPDGKRYYRVMDLPKDHPFLDLRVKWMRSTGTEWLTVREEDPDMLVARA